MNDRRRSEADTTTHRAYTSWKFHVTEQYEQRLFDRMGLAHGAQRGVKRRPAHGAQRGAKHTLRADDYSYPIDHPHQHPRATTARKIWNHSQERQPWARVVFYFKSSKKSNNGTDVNAGQLPQLLYRVITPDVQTSNQTMDQSESITILSYKFSRTVTPECFQSILKLLHWSWKALKAGLREVSESPASVRRALLPDLRRLLYICVASLHLLRIYINEVYPAGPPVRKIPPESARMAECVADTQALLRRILSDGGAVAAAAEGDPFPPGSCLELQTTLVEECEAAFMACYHAFYPSTLLKWRGLCDLLSEPAVLWSAENSDRLLAAVLASLCSPTGQLTFLLPPSLERDVPPRPCSDGLGSSSSPDTPAFSGPEPPLPGSSNPAADSSAIYPVLVEVAMRRTEREGLPPESCSFREVLERLMAIVVAPVQGILKHDAERPSPKLVSSTCAFLSAVVAELSSQTIGCVVDVQRATRQALHCTPSRFARVSQNRTWNTGNGSPDAICFSVDRPGVLVAGACIYGGVGNEWHYELELLDDSGSGGDPSHTQRWKTLDVIRGTFGPEDCYADVAELKFDRPIPIKENTKYAVRLRNHGARTNNGDGGVTQVKGPDGTSFSFSDCSLSFNGTNHTRGQIPQILYYSTPLDTESQQASRDLVELQARRNVLNICGTIVKASAQLLSEAASEQDDGVILEIGSSHLMTQLLPLILAHLCPVASTDAQSAVEVLDLVQKLLKWVATLNQRAPPPTDQPETTGADGTGPVFYATVESDHPYKPATVFVSKVKFPPSVRWMSLEFDSRCGTAQAEDGLQLYIPSRNDRGTPLSPQCTAALRTSDDAEEEDLSAPYWPVLRRFGGALDWPATATILPDSLAKEKHIARLGSRRREQNQRRKRRRRATEAMCKREARRRQHSTPAEQFPGATVTFRREFVENPFDVTCAVCDRLWFAGDLSAIGGVSDEKNRETGACALRQCIELADVYNEPACRTCRDSRPWTATSAHLYRSTYRG
ncbi:E3 ubiquitin-protein ligase MYCBP2 [Ixodes scapularis]